MHTKHLELYYLLYWVFLVPSVPWVVNMFILVSATASLLTRKISSVVSSWAVCAWKRDEILYSFLFRRALIISRCSFHNMYNINKYTIWDKNCYRDFKTVHTFFFCSANDPDRMEQSKYNYETIHNINPYGADFCVTCREGMKHWNMCVQYWLAVYVYKQIPFKQFRTAITMFVSAVWHGVYMGYYICICSVPIYLVVEDLYVKLFIKNNRGLVSLFWIITALVLISVVFLMFQSLKIWEWIIWFLKMQFFSYFAIAFHLLEVHKVIHYYNSIYHVGWIFAAILYAYGLLILKMRKNSVQEEGGHNLKLKAGWLF